MRISATFLKSRVARRIFGLFIACSLLPILALAVMSMRQVNEELTAQGRRQLYDASKAEGLAILERLGFVSGQLRLIGSGTAHDPAALLAPQVRPGADDTPRFVGVQRIEAGGSRQTLSGTVSAIPAGTPEEQAHLAAGGTALCLGQAADGSPAFFLKQAAEPAGSGALVVAQVNPDFLWGINTRSELTDLLVLSPEGDVLFSSIPQSEVLPDAVRDAFKSGTRGTFLWKSGNKEYLAGHYSLFLRPRFLLPRMNIVISRSQDDLLAPVRQFRNSFVLVLLLTFWVVLLLSLMQIRRSLVPLEQLGEATRRLSRREFDVQVDVKSGDEFEELAGSFNLMSARLGAQFNALMTLNEIAGAILAAFDRKGLVNTILNTMPGLLPAQAVGVCLLEPAPATGGRLSYRLCGAEDAHMDESVEISPEELRALQTCRDVFSVGANAVPGYLRPLAARDIKAFLVLPLRVENHLAGLIVFGSGQALAPRGEVIAHVRQVADEVAVALTNVRLLEKLDRWNWGTLTALARAIDAKSHWTSGHSERVTYVAVEIGKQMGLPPRELDILHRGGLLHDIGKIATPVAILDKPGRLTEEERKIMQDHVRQGARILEPIPGFDEIMPIVLEHHEWFNGGGYPAGIAGEAITLHGRIFAVADVFDALTSDRPYRPGWKRADAIQYIREKAGVQFDPAAVSVFLSLADRLEVPPRLPDQPVEPAGVNA